MRNGSEDRPSEPFRFFSQLRFRTASRRHVVAAQSHSYIRLLWRRSVHPPGSIIYLDFGPSPRMSATELIRLASPLTLRLRQLAFHLKCKGSLEPRIINFLVSEFCYQNFARHEGAYELLSRADLCIIIPGNWQGNSYRRAAIARSNCQSSAH
jgi:hypothetical protein